MCIISDAITDHPEDPNQSSEHGRNVASCAVSLVTELIVKSQREPDYEPATSILRDFPKCKGVLQEAVNVLLGSQAGSGKWAFPLLAVCFVLMSL